MTKITQQEIVVLGLLYEHHHYAYRLEEIMNKRGMGNWADTEFSSMDHVLKRLEDKGLVLVKIRNGDDKASRKVYFITDEGRSVLKKEIKSFLSKKAKVLYPFDLGLANIHVLDHDELIQSLNNYIKSLEERIEILENSMKIQNENNVPYNFIAIYQRSLVLMKAEKHWIKEFLEEIETNSN